MQSGSQIDFAVGSLSAAAEAAVDQSYYFAVVSAVLIEVSQVEAALLNLAD